jgi:folate-binding protein YgfZ
MIIDQPDWGHIRVTGADRARFLHGVTTCNVTALAPGGQTWGAILSPKGRVLAVVQIVREPDGDDAYWVHVEPSLTDKTLALLEHHAMLDDVAFARVDGPAHRSWTTPADVWAAAPVLAAPPGPALPMSDPAVEALRIRAGLPWYGVDVDDSAFPFETPLAQFLDYGKGCYIGQEPVFRVHAQGKAARALRGLILAAPVAVGAAVHHADKRNAGEVTSVIADGAGAIALAYLHRTAWDVGGTVEVEGQPATVAALPMA